MLHPPPTRHSFLSLSLLLLFLTPASHALVLRSPNGTITHLTSPYFYFGLTTFNLSAPLILPPPTASLSACHPLPPLPTPHAIVYVEPLGCSIETKIRHCQQANARAVISASSADVAGNEVFTQWDGTDKSLLHIPFLHVGRDEGEALRAALLQWTIDTNGTDTHNGSTWTASMSSQEASVNVWAVAYDSVYFLTLFQTLLGLFNLFLILLASRKLYQYHHKTVASSPSAVSSVPLPSSSMSVPYLCLSLLLFSSLIVALYCLVDPFGAKHVLPYVYCRVLLFLCIPLCLASLLLLLLFISDALLSSTRTAAASPSASSPSSSPILLSSSPVITRAFSFASALSSTASSTLRPTWLQRRLARHDNSRLLSPSSTLLFFACLAFLTLFDFSMSVLDSLYLSDVINAVTQLTYACIALFVLGALVVVGVRAAGRMWEEEQRRKDRTQRRQDEAAELQQEREEARKRPLDVDEEEMDRVEDVCGTAELLGLPDTSMRMSVACKHHTPTASPSMLPFTSFAFVSTIRSLPDLPLLRVDSFPSSSTSYQLIHLHPQSHHTTSTVPAPTLCDVDEHTPPPLLSSPSFSSTTSLLAGSGGVRCVNVNVLSVMEGMYGVPRLYRLMRFVVLACIGLIGLVVLLCWRPLDSPLTFIGRQGALFVCVGWLSASMISVF